MINREDLQDRLDNLIVLYAEHPGPIASMAPERVGAEDAARGRALTLAASKTLGTTWRDWFHLRGQR